MVNLFFLKKSLIQKDAGGAYAGKQCCKFRFLIYETEIDKCLNIWVLNIRNFLKNLSF